MQPSSLDRVDLRLRLAIIAIIVVTLGWFSRHSSIDDALIYSRYIANALHGLGLVFNAGEHVNALTSPLYSYLTLAAAKLLHGQVLAAAAVVSGLFLFFSCSLAEILVPFAGLLIASTGYFYSLVGMESSCFLCMLLLTVVLLQREYYNWLPTVGILLLLTRWEGGALLLPLCIELYRRRRRPSVMAFVPAALIVLVYLALNRYWYGSALPASAGAKFGQGRSGYWGHWPFAFFHGGTQLKTEFLSTFYVIVLIAILVIPGIIKLWSSAFNRLIFPFLTILLAFYLLFNIPGYKWYYAPFVCFTMVYACAALPKSGLWRWAAVPVILLSAISAGQRFHNVKPRSPNMGYLGMCNWLLANAPANARIETAEIGTLGYYAQGLYFMDILGLTLPKNAEHIANGDPRSWLAEDRPDYIVVHNSKWTFETVAKESPDYERVPVDFGSAEYLLRRKDTAK